MLAQEKYSQKNNRPKHGLLFATTMIFIVIFMLAIFIPEDQAKSFANWISIKTNYTTKLLKAKMCKITETQNFNDPIETFTEDNNLFINIQARSAKYIKRKDHINKTMSKVTKILDEQKNSPRNNHHIRVEGHAWVKSVNPKPIADHGGSSTLEFGDTCSLQYGSMERLDTVNDKPLFRYVSTNAGYGAPCPGGTLFLGNPYEEKV